MGQILPSDLKINLWHGLTNTGKSVTLESYFAQLS